MRVVGIIFVLAASVAIQLPWFSCHSDCQHAFLPVWDLGVHHCHDETAPDHGHHCLAHCCERGGAPKGEDQDEDDHGPGDHDLQFQLSRRPTPSQTATPALTPASLAVVSPASIDAATPGACADRVPDGFDTGPPERLASVRLLL